MCFILCEPTIGATEVRSEDWEFNILPYMLILAVFASMCLPPQFPQGHFCEVGVDTEFGPWLGCRFFLTGRQNFQLSWEPSVGCFVGIFVSPGEIFNFLTEINIFGKNISLKSLLVMLGSYSPFKCGFKIVHIPVLTRIPF